MNSSKPRRTLAGPIFRVRTGCLTCRGRKKKCDETKPRCRGCERNRLECKWPPSAAPKTAPPKPAGASETARQEGGESAGASAQSEASPSMQESPPRQSNQPSHSSPMGQNTSPSQSSESPSGASTGSSPRPPTRASAASPNDPQSSPENPLDFLASLDFLSFPTPAVPGSSRQDEETPEAPTSLVTASPVRAAASPVTQVPRTLSFLPGTNDSFSMELLSHYLAATTISMANGSTVQNPFSEQLIPMAFKSDLVLQLLLAQSAVHRAAKSLNDFDSVANTYYDRSLRLFQQNLSKFMGEQSREQTLLLGIAALILCFIETAKGDINGTTYDHLIAAKSLIVPSLPLLISLPKSMRQFLVEYYVYTATLSMISIDARISDQYFLDNDMALLATELVAESYVGNLCGTWLNLILLIPPIFDLARRVQTRSSTPGWRPSADEFMLFAQLQSQVQAWTPNPAVSPDVALAGYVYHKAVTLYLYTALHPLSGDENGIMAVATQTALAEALSHLAQLDPTVRVNTSLCWPIAVIGSCVVDEGQRTFLRERLGHTFASIGLGNIRQTSVLLQHIWDEEDAAPMRSGPWSVCRVMNEHQIWISFA
ncbi:Beauvericin cluster-specific repressor BEA4 [Colletotrichum siamense]|uniref:Beauvericin cluster-specific repressor BEA4 n=1 Tax=Colletotrichum siamense TaxID=690259 RepID=A0A9P5EQK7_COLSI|nr:Beauvericin cluster-specific repressor BEA4 [Colletotrichum siamense]